MGFRFDNDVESYLPRVFISFRVPHVTNAKAITRAWLKVCGVWIVSSLFFPTIAQSLSPTTPSERAHCSCRLGPFSANRHNPWLVRRNMISVRCPLDASHLLSAALFLSARMTQLEMEGGHRPCVIIFMWLYFCLQCVSVRTVYVCHVCRPKNI